MSGTIGQPDADTMSGGAFAVTGGFWPGVTGFALGPLPTLSIRLGSGNTVIQSWPDPSTA